MICCPTSKIAKPDILGAIYRIQIQKKGIKKQEDPRGLKLDWSHPQVEWLSDPRPAVVKVAIDVLAKKNNIDALRLSSAGMPAVWTLHPQVRKLELQFVNSFLAKTLMCVPRQFTAWHCGVIERLSRR